MDIMQYDTIALAISGLLLAGFALSLLLAGPLMDSGPNTWEAQVGVRIMGIGVMLLPPAFTLTGVATLLTPSSL